MTGGHEKESMIANHGLLTFMFSWTFSIYCIYGCCTYHMISSGFFSVVSPPPNHIQLSLYCAEFVP